MLENHWSAGFLAQHSDNMESKFKFKKGKIMENLYTNEYTSEMVNAIEIVTMKDRLDYEYRDPSWQLDAPTVKLKSILDNKHEEACGCLTCSIASISLESHPTTTTTTEASLCNHIMNCGCVECSYSAMTDKNSDEASPMYTGSLSSSLYDVGTNEACPTDVGNYFDPIHYREIAYCRATEYMEKFYGHGYNKLKDVIETAEIIFDYITKGTIPA